MQAGMMGQEPPSLGITRLMMTLGLVFQIIFALFFFLVLGVIGLLAATAVGLGIAFLILPIIFLVVFGLIPLIMLYVAYEFCYKRIKNRQYEQAKGPLLIVAIIEIIFGGLLPGIFYLIAYIKLGDVINETRGAPPGWAPGYNMAPGAPMAQPYGAPPQGYAAPPQGYASPPQGYAAPPGQAAPAYSSPPAQTYAPAAAAAPAAALSPAGVPACPRCSRPATFVPQYNRYYCYSCAQYL
ncbi:MAG: phage holin family protein [Thermoplasmata archaeon]|nr:phage holin family protein [Thermoplasmata archaeon]